LLAPRCAGHGLYERKFQQFVRAPLLNDFAVKPLPRPHDEDFHDLIAARFERAASILTSNLDEVFVRRSTHCIVWRGKLGVAARYALMRCSA
jgi:hypothetical protein